MDSSDVGGSHDPEVDRLSAMNVRFRGHDTRDWAAFSEIGVTDADQVPLEADRALVTRCRASHRGIGERQALRHLIAVAANQAFLDEICTIVGLRRLELEYPVTATHLDGLRSLRNLEHLSIDSPRNITDFTPVLDLPNLRTLLIANAKHLTDLEWLASAHHLEVLGIEGSIWTNQRIPTLAPLAGLRGLRAFFATSVRLDDQDLSPLAACPSLEFLGCARLAPHREFVELADAKPDLECSWFRAASW